MSSPETPHDLSTMSMLDLFRLEAGSHGAVLAEGLKALEKNPALLEPLPPLIRAVHSIKGAAHIVEIAPIVEITMAMQRAIVSTSSGVAGLGLEHGHSVWIADTPQEFAAAILHLLNDADLRATLARNARNMAVAKYGWPALAELQTQLWRSLLVR